MEKEKKVDKEELKDKPEEVKKEEKKSEEKGGTGKEDAKKHAKSEVEKKSEAVARGVSIHASKKHCMYICDFIKNKSIDQAISELNEVIKLKRAVPFKGEIPHRRGMMSGRYPVRASKIFIKILKSLRGNVIVNGMDLEKTRIAIAYANQASRPLRAGRVRAKRTHVTLIAKEIGGEE